MLKRLVVHIGHDKTGTTSLQETFTASSAALEQAGLCYPRPSGSGYATAHHGVSIEFGGRGDAFAPGKHFEAFRNAVSRTSSETALFSSEGLVPIPIAKAAGALSQFAAIAERVDVLIYLRHPVRYASSAVSQGLRLGRTLDEIIAAPPIIDHAGLVQRWQSAYARAGVDGQLILKPYLRDHDPSWSLVDDVLAVCGLTGSVADLTPVRSDANPGLCALAVYLVDWINRQPLTAPPVQAGLAAFNHLEGRPYVLPHDVQVKIRKVTGPATDWLAQHHGFSFPEAERLHSFECPLSEKELASLARLLLASTQFAYEVERSRPGWWFGLRSPYTTRKLSHPIYNSLKSLGLLSPLIGEYGRRARTVRKRLLAPRVGDKL